MPTLSVTRWGGLGAVLAGMAWIASGFLADVSQAQELLPGLLLTIYLVEGTPLVGTLFVLAAVLFTLVGMTGLHALQQERITTSGWLGLLIIIVLFLGQALGALTYLVVPPLFPIFRLFLNPVVGALGLLVSFVLYSEATMRANVLPLWCNMILTPGTAMALALGSNIGNVLFGLFWLAFGYLLLQ
ncbi:MAG: hypothetical protein M3248_01150, partial [Actinomycetota bacterium]|nr:hypothetical protein [Actinomycetota bacterium]